MKRILAAVLTALFMILTIGAQSAAAASSNEIAVAKKSSISINHEKVSLSVRERLQLQVTYASGSKVSGVTWSTSDRKIAKVTSTGLVTAVKKGTATITGKTNKGEKFTCKVTVVTTPAIQSIRLNEKETSVRAGKSILLKAIIAPSKADTRVTWTTSDEKIAKVSYRGVVSGVKKGTATITARAANGKTAVCEVTVLGGVYPDRITLSKTQVTVKQNDVVRLTAVIVPAKANQTVRWSSSDEGAAVVASDGTVYAVGDTNGKWVTITAEAINGLTATCRIKIKPRTQKPLPKEDIYVYVNNKLIKLPMTYAKTQKALPNGTTVVEDGYITYNTSYITFDFDQRTKKMVGVTFKKNSSVMTYKKVKIGEGWSKALKAYGIPQYTSYDEEHNELYYVYTMENDWMMWFRVKRSTGLILDIALFGPA